MVFVIDTNFIPMSKQYDVGACKGLAIQLELEVEGIDCLYI
jgi:hypothetical protein